MPQLADTCDLPRAPDARGTILARVFNELDRAGVAWCVLHGYEAYPARVTSDVDLLLPAEWLAGRLARVLQEASAEIGAWPVLWLDDGAQYIVLAGLDERDQTRVLQLHVSADYSLAGRVFYRGREILTSRTRRGEFWTPAASIEFGCIVANRIVKTSLRPEHELQLARLFEQDPCGCEREAKRFFGPASAQRIAAAASGGQWEQVRRNLPALRRELLTGRGAPRAGGWAARWVRRLRRWARPPCGLHVVLLGPDGVGKSTVIDGVCRDLGPVFLRTKCLTFAPGLLPGRFEPPKPGGPHSLPPRSFPASLIKAAWWAICYTAGYYLTIHPTLARAGIVINHRYLPDAIVDPRRYRYSGPISLLRLLWRIAPKPDLLFLLDAAPQVIQARKREVCFEETARQREAYRAIVSSLPFAHVIDAGRPAHDVIGDVERLILRHLRDRTARQLGVGGSA